MKNMENKENNLEGIQQNLLRGFQMLTDFSLSTLDSSMKYINSSQPGKDSCTPKNECPPHCLLLIERHAISGERIVVPFMIRNSSGTQRRYRVGMRELKNINGSAAPSQPRLNKNQVLLEAGMEELVLMEIDLREFSNGNTYSTEIVIREKEINQNICFKLIVGLNKVPVAKPLDEKKYTLRWQGWETHFYCEQQKKNQ
jgi:hypothetical protein